MYKLQVRSGDDPNVLYAVDPTTRKAIEFKKREEAYTYAAKLRAKSSIGVWFKVEPINN